MKPVTILKVSEHLRLIQIFQSTGSVNILLHSMMFVYHDRQMHYINNKDLDLIRTGIGGQQPTGTENLQAYPGVIAAFCGNATFYYRVLGHVGQFVRNQ
jgi:hypothetical protein